MLKNFKKILTSSCLLLGATFAVNIHAAVIKTDIVMIVDESGSMNSVQVNLRANIGLFASILSAGGIDANYALVGYGAGSDNIRTLTDFTDPSGFATAAGNLVASGGYEPAFDAVAYALNANADEASSFSFRSDAVKNLIIFTDEPDRVGTYDFGDADNLLMVNNALFNAVLEDGDTRTLDSIGPLATNHGGAVFSLDDLGSLDNQIVEDFVTAFAMAKLQETIDFCVVNPNDPACINTGPTPDPTNSVPAPPALALFALGLVGLLRKRA